MHRIPLIVGNWKMYKSSLEAEQYIAALAKLTASTQRRIYLAVPAIAIVAAARAIQGSKLVIGAQNMHDALEGAFTGEISAPQLVESGARFVILGHSERRSYFGESNAFIQKKVLRALEQKLTPILCIGEQLRERESGQWEEVLKTQLDECLLEVSKEQMPHVIIAYEPVWAIGTGRTATAELAQSVHRFVRDWIENRYGHEVSMQVSILYGGSVKRENIASLMEQTDIDGVLVGGASLDAEGFSQIINY